MNKAYITVHRLCNIKYHKNKSDTDIERLQKQYEPPHDKTNKIICPQ